MTRDRIHWPAPERDGIYRSARTGLIVADFPNPQPVRTRRPPGWYVAAVVALSRFAWKAAVIFLVIVILHDFLGYP